MSRVLQGFYSILLLTFGLFLYALQQSSDEISLLISSPTPSTTTVANIVEGERVTLTGAADGDTLYLVRANGEKATLRVIGVDTPETVDPRKTVQCYGKEASALTKSLAKNSEGILTIDPTQQEYDKYNRLLGYITLPSGEDLGEKLLREGYATEYTYSVPYQKQQTYKQAEASARAAQKGFWNPATCNGQR